MTGLHAAPALHHRLRRVRGILPAAAAALLLALSGCNGDDIGALPEALPPPSAGTQYDELRGTWEQCFTFISTDATVTYVFDGLGTLTGYLTAYDSTDLSCTTNPVPDPPQDFMYVIGAPVSASLGGGVVTAHEFDVTPLGGSTTYTIYYIDYALAPDGLYFGDESGVNDGTTPALRPNVLNETPPAPVRRL